MICFRQPMATELNRSAAHTYCRSIAVLLLLWRNILIVRPEDIAVDDGVTSRKTPRDSSLRVAGDGEGSSFKVALFADLHFGENAWTDWGPQQDLNSVNVMSTVLDVERPANNLPIHNASFYWDQAISPTRARNIPWASLFGNHDDAPFEWPIDWFSSSGIPHILCPRVNSSGGDECSFKGTTRLELMRNEIMHSLLSYTGFGPRNLWPSVSNYVLTLVSPKRDPKSPLMFMYFLDSGGGSYPEVISSIQSEWFHNKSQEVNPDSSVPEIVFWHIPSKAYEKVAKKAVGKRTQCVGSMFQERVAAQEAEMGMMKLLKERPSVKAVFVGHNHGLDWCCPYEKMWLCYARHTGYGGYGNWARGARILEISDEPFSLKSWIRMENGTFHSEVVLAT
ncbi:Metallophosphoesterase domain-containing protein [Cynara cardunculus var. scolymus]|uniref:Metallophosphoesterase domain-containing protein n=1 Tax=Cynara cardunculus var. scolymus TaxID=59895 RepID=A0A118K556_CYNCS|nr:Metallophosphoesterase domain-containing protein [Cynara cardunculus var. scolymus]